MALRKNDGTPFETEDEWKEFFMKTLKFPTTSSEQYSKYLSSECFTGDTLADCIEDENIPSLLKMPMGHFKKLKSYIKPPQSQGTSSMSTSGRIQKIH